MPDATSDVMFCERVDSQLIARTPGEYARRRRARQATIPLPRFEPHNLLPRRVTLWLEGIGVIDLAPYDGPPLHPQQGISASPCDGPTPRGSTRRSRRPSRA